MYLEDAFGARVWVDDPSLAARQFSANVLTMFQTPETIAESARRQQQLASGVDVRQRFFEAYQRVAIIKNAVGTVRRLLTSPDGSVPLRNCLLTWCSLAELRELRECVNDELFAKWLDDATSAPATRQLIAVLVRRQCRTAADDALLRSLLTFTPAFVAASQSALLADALYDALTSSPDVANGTQLASAVLRDLLTSDTSDAVRRLLFRAVVAALYNLRFPLNSIYPYYYYCLFIIACACGNRTVLETNR